MKSKAIPATTSPTIRDIAWAAGFLEGEGYFGLHTGLWISERIQARQNDPECLDRLQTIFGGYRSKITQRCNKLSNKPTIEDWAVYGPRAKGIMMTVFPFMSARRKDQIKAVLEGRKIKIYKERLE